MWQRFTERARRVIFFAQEEATRLDENGVSTEHLLLGLVRETNSVAARVLERLGVSSEQVRSEIERQAVRGEGRTGQDMQLTAQAKQVIDFAYDEARRLNNNYIGTDHLLLGVLREGENLAGRVLLSLGVDLERVRHEVMQLQDESEDANEVKARDVPSAPVPQADTSTEPKTGSGGNWQRFTERARRTVFYAQEEAGRLGENYVSTEHLLLGIVREDDSVAARILERIGVSLGRVRSEIERQVARGDGRLGQDMQLTPRAKRVIDLAYDEARQLNNNYIGTEHLLLGLIREGEGLAGRILNKLGVDLERARREIRQLQDGEAEAEAKEAVKEDADYRKTLEERVRDLAQRLTSGDIAGAQSMDELLAALSAKSAMPDATEADREAAADPQIGDLGTATPAEGQTHVEAARGSRAFVALRDAYQARDTHGYRALFTARVPGITTQAFFLDAGTALKLLAPPSHAYLATEAQGLYVRILSGPHEGRAVWMLRSAFVRTGLDNAPFPPPLTEPEIASSDAPPPTGGDTD